MDTRTRKSRSVLALLALMLFLPALAHSQTVLTDTTARDLLFVSNGYGTVSTDIIGCVVYKGTSACGDVAVAAGGDITFQKGTCGAEAVDTNVECDSSIAAVGARSGVFDLSTPHANCDTWGEVADLINADGSGWLFVPIGVERGDSTDNTAITLVEIDATTKKGVCLLRDSTVALNFTLAFPPPGSTPTDISTYIHKNSGGDWRVLPNPWRGREYRLIDFVDTVTTGGAATLTVDCTLNAFNQTSGAWTETKRTIWSSATAASTSQFTKTFPYLKCEADEKMITRITATTSLTAATAFASGYSESAR